MRPAKSKRRQIAHRGKVQAAVAWHVCQVRELPSALVPVAQRYPGRGRGCPLVQVQAPKGVLLFRSRQRLLELFLIIADIVQDAKRRQRHRPQVLVGPVRVDWDFVNQGKIAFVLDLARRDAFGVLIFAVADRFLIAARRRDGHPKRVSARLAAGRQRVV